MTVIDNLAGALGDACGAAMVRPGEPDDAVHGVVPRWVAAPASAEALSALLAAATEHELTVLPRGEGTKLHWGRPPARVDVVIELAGLSGIIEHYTDDAVVTAGAGTPVRTLQALLAGSGQRLAVDPGSADATLGGMLATGEAGPLRLRHGSPRDLLLGTEFVRADGAIAHSGGRVVKNVAGYDLGKLLAGSWGTLGIMTSVTLRLQPLPAARSWVVRSVRTPLEVHDLVSGVLDGYAEPAAIEMDLPGSGPGTLAILLEGSISGVRGRAADVVRMLGDDASVRPEAPQWWGRYPFAPDEVALKMAVPVADLHAAIYALRDAVGCVVPVRGSAGVGVCYASVRLDRAEIALDAVRTTLIARGGNCVVLSAPAGAAEHLDVWGRIDGLALMRSVKDQFDPDGIFAPGRFVGGI